MTTRELILDYIGYRKSQGDQSPIFSIMVFENPNKGIVYPNGKYSGFPDVGASSYIGFYYDIDTAIAALNENWGDMREFVYNAAFILCTFPGLYESSGKSERMYFVWDDKRKGFFQKEEPEIFAHIAY